MAGKKNYNNPDTRATTGILEKLGLKEGLSREQLKTKLATMSQKTVRQALKWAKFVGGARGAALGAAATFVLSKMGKPSEVATTGDLGALAAKKTKKKEKKKEVKAPPKKPKIIDENVSGSPTFAKAPPKKPKEIDKLMGGGMAKKSYGIKYNVGGAVTGKVYGSVDNRRRK